MKIKYFILIFSCIFCLTQNLHSSGFYQTPQTNQTFHTVATGETAYSIAKKYDVSVEDVYRLNPDAKNGIKAGQVLRIAKPVNTTQNEDSYILHSIQSKETLYSVSKQYNVSVEDILALNPGINSSNFRIGTAVRIPKNTNVQKAASTTAISSSITSQPGKPDDKYITHIVKSKETLYSLSNAYKVSMQEIVDANPGINSSGLKKDMVIRIPKPGTYIAQNQGKITPSGIDDENVLKIGLLLPFFEKKDNLQARFIEYYEGFLLAVQDMKAKGCSAEIYTFDIRKGNDTKKLESLLETNEMKNLNLIIGGVTDEEIGIISRFAEKENIRYAAPFPIKNKNVIKDDHTYLVNVPQADLFPKAAERFARHFVTYNVIFVMDQGKNNDKKDFMNELKSVLERKGITNRSVQISSTLTLANELKFYLSKTSKNILIPTSSSQATLNKIMPVVKSMKNDNPEISISLFGYPDWQTYRTYTQDFHNYDTYIYTPFFIDANESKYHRFAERYNEWYNKSMIDTYPRYACLGYDTGLYFMSTLHNKGSLLQNETFFGNSSPTIQSAFYFEKVTGAKGYMNTGIYFMHYKPDMTIEKIDYSK